MVNVFFQVISKIAAMNAFVAAMNAMNVSEFTIQGHTHVGIDRFLTEVRRSFEDRAIEE